MNEHSPLRKLLCKNLRACECSLKVKIIGSVTEQKRSNIIF